MVSSLLMTFSDAFSKNIILVFWFGLHLSPFMRFQLRMSLGDGFVWNRWQAEPMLIKHLWITTCTLLTHLLTYMMIKSWLCKCLMIMLVYYFGLSIGDRQYVWHVGCAMLSLSSEIPSIHHFCYIKHTANSILVSDYVYDMTQKSSIIILTSWHGNAFSITGLLCGDFTDP